MEQLSLFDNGEASVNEKFDEEENAVDSEAEEVEIKNYTPEQQEILSFAKGIIQESLDPWCPLGIYITPKRIFRIDYYDGQEKTIYMQFASADAAKKSTEKRKMFKGATIRKIEEIDEVPSDTKVFGTKADLFSFIIDLSLSKPKWFSIENKNKFYRVQIVFNPNDENLSEETKQILQKYSISKTGIWINVDTKTKDHADLMKMLVDLRPILKKRFDFLYDYRLVEQCGCELQSGTVSIEYYVKKMNKTITPETIIVNNCFVKISDDCCIDQKQCLSKNREMQMKCGFRRLMERKGEFVTSPKYKGY